MSVQQFPEFSNSNFLIHIAFHFNRERLQFLKKVISTISEYPFKQIDLVIDTNDREFQSSALELSLPAHINIRVSVHSNLKHPFLLTWAHRANIAEQKNNYDYYMYVEDDIAISNEALKFWRLDSILLSPHDKVRGFLRSEVDVDNIIVSTDFMKPARCKEMIKIDGKSYLRPKNPYQGFWVYSNKQLELFMASKCWKDGNHGDWAVRERASAGMMWQNKNAHCLLIPIVNFSIPDYVLVKHLPNNYALNESSNIATIKISDLVPKNRLVRLCMMLKLLLDSIFR